MYGHVGGKADEARVAVRLPGSGAAPQGQMHLRYGAANTHWFDAQSGKRIES